MNREDFPQSILFIYSLQPAPTALLADHSQDGREDWVSLLMTALPQTSTSRKESKRRQHLYSTTFAIQILLLSKPWGQIKKSSLKKVQRLKRSEQEDTNLTAFNMGYMTALLF